MTKAEIDAVLERVKTWPPERQEDAAEMLRHMEEQEEGVYVLSPEEEAELDEGEAGGDAPPEEVEAIFARYGL